MWKVNDIANIGGLYMMTHVGNSHQTKMNILGVQCTFSLLHTMNDAWLVKRQLIQLSLHNYYDDEN